MQRKTDRQTGTDTETEIRTAGQRDRQRPIIKTQNYRMMKTAISRLHFFHGIRSLLQRNNNDLHYPNGRKINDKKFHIFSYIYDRRYSGQREIIRNSRGLTENQCPDDGPHLRNAGVVIASRVIMIGGEWFDRLGLPQSVLFVMMRQFIWCRLLLRRRWSDRKRYINRRWGTSVVADSWPRSEAFSHVMRDSDGSTDIYFQYL